MKDKGYRVHVAKPERRRIQKGHTVKYSQQHDLLQDWDLLGVHPDKMILMVQVTRDEGNVSEKMATIAERRPKYPVHHGDFEFWVWRNKEFNVYELNEWNGYGWELMTAIPVDDPKAMLARADTSLG